MKIISVLISFLFISATQQHCAQKPVAQAAKPAVDTTANVSIYSLESFPTQKKEQDSSVSYFSDFRIIEPVAITKLKQENLKKLLADTANFSSVNMKGCPFLAKYGLTIANGTGYTNYVFSGENCAKVQVTSSADTLKKIVYLDVINNSIYTSLTQ